MKNLNKNYKKFRIKWHILNLLDQNCFKISNNVQKKYPNFWMIFKRIQMTN